MKKGHTGKYKKNCYHKFAMAIVERQFYTINDGHGNCALNLQENFVKNINIPMANLFLGQICNYILLAMMLQNKNHDKCV